MDVLGRETMPRRPAFSIGLSGALQHYVGDYDGGLNRPGAEASLRYRLGGPTSVFLNAGQGQLAAGTGGRSLNQTFNYAEAGLLLRLLPQDVFTPYVLAGGGVTARSQAATPEQPKLLPHLLAGLGAEYLLTPHLGLNAGFDVHYYLSDQLDGLRTGRYNDYYLAARAGISLYIGPQPRRVPTPH